MSDYTEHRELVVHPAAEMFPLIEGCEYDDLVTSIRDNGLDNPLVLAKDGRLLDGRNRLRACRVAGVEPRFVTYEGDDLLDFIVRANVYRRHLTAGQRAMVALEVLPLYEVEAQNRMKAGVADPSKDSDQGSANGKATAHAAQTVGVSHQSVAVAKRIAADCPDLADEVRAGRLTLNAADLMLRRRERDVEQREQQITSLATLPRIVHRDGLELLASFDGEVDLVFTDPIYASDLDDIAAFAHAWMPLARQALAPTGRFYSFIGSSGPEVLAYLEELSSWGWEYQQLIWSYTDTLGPSPTYRYANTHQVLLHAWGPQAAPLPDCPLLERTTVWEFANHSGYLGGREHVFQKPDALAERVIRHATGPGDVVLDPFAGTGTHLLAAAAQGRIAVGAECDSQMLAIAARRGVSVDVDEVSLCALPGGSSKRAS